MRGGPVRIHSPAPRAANVERELRLHPMPASDQHAGGLFRETTHFDAMHQALSRASQELAALHEAEVFHRLLFEKVPDPRFVCDGRSLRLLEVNDAALRHYRFSRDEFLQMKFTDLFLPEEIPRLLQFCRQARAREANAMRQQDHVFRQRKKNGLVIDVAVDTALIPLRGRRLFLFLAQDVTFKLQAEKRLRAQHAVTRALGESSTVAEASPKIFRALCESFGCDWAELWRVSPEEDLLRCAQTWQPGSPDVAGVARHGVFTRGEGIAGAVWARNKPLWITDVTRRPEYQRATVAKHGLRTVFAFPIRLNEEVLGVIAIFSRHVLPPDKHILLMLRDICSQIGQVMGRRRVERQLLEVSEREQQRIGQDLHDGLCQRLTGVAYMASDLRAKLDKSAMPEASIAARISELSRETAVQARQIARGLNPVKMGNVGLIAALGELTSSIRAMFSIACRFECRQRMFVRDHETAVHLYRIAQEAIHNAITHGMASDIVVSLNGGPGPIVLSVKDNGRGLSRVSAGGGGMGFENMNYRARAIGAQLQFAPRDRGGTVMTCTLSLSEGKLR